MGSNPPFFTTGTVSSVEPTLCTNSGSASCSALGSASRCCEKEEPMSQARFNREEGDGRGV